MKKKSTAFVTEITFKKETKIIHYDLQLVKKDIRSLKDELQLVKDDVQSVKDDVQSVKDDVQSVKDDVQSVKDDLHSVKNEIKALHTSVERLALSDVKIQEDLAEVKRTMATKSDIDRILNIVADYAKNTHIVLQNQQVHRGYIHDHEARLLALEKRPAS